MVLRRQGASLLSHPFINAFTEALSCRWETRIYLICCLTALPYINFTYAPHREEKGRMYCVCHMYVRRGACMSGRVPSPAFREKTDLNGNGATRPYYAQ